MKKLEPTYIYENPDGSSHSGILERNLRGKPVREFLHYDNSKKCFLHGFNNHEKILYRLPVITKADKIILCENEKIADEFIKLKLPATCATSGFEGWTYRDAKMLKNKSVLVLRSGDPAEQRNTETRVIPTLIDNTTDFHVFTAPGKSVEKWLKYSTRETVFKSINLLKESKDDYFTRLREKQNRLTDSGNAEIFALMYCDNVKYIPEKDIWINWDGTHWKPDLTGYTMGLTKYAADSIWTEVKKRHGTENTSELISWAKHSLSHGARTNMLRLAKNEELLRIPAERLDADPFLINFSNGTYSLKDGTFYDHNKSDLLTHCLNYNLDFRMRYPHWKEFLKQITEGDEDKERFLQQAAGYTLSGVTDHQNFFFLHGPGGSGKSTFCEVLLTIMGSLATKVPTELFMESDGGSKPFELANLVGKRFVLAQEVQTGHLWNEGRLKDATGQDTINAEKKHKDSFTYKPQFKLWFYANFWPSLRNVDRSIIRRMRIIPFTYQPKKLEKGLQKKLLSEAPGIIAWALMGFEDLQNSGWAKCEAMEKAEKRYFAEQDVVNLFLADNVQYETGFYEKSSNVYKAYVDFCRENGYNSYSQRRFGETMEMKDIKQVRRSDGQHFQGVILKK